jgi:outer membrane receptor protein involved in Fe transport
MREPGTYHAAVVEGGTFELRLGAIGFAPETRLVRAGDADDELDIHLLPAPVPVQELVARVEAERRPERQGHTIHYIELGERASPSTTLADWLAGLPGLELRRRGQGGPQSVAMRGSRPEAVLVILDGMPINDPLTGTADLSGIPTRSLQSATVLLGANAGGGPGATAGLVSLRTRSAPRGMTAALTAGSFGRVGLDLATGSSGRLGTLGVGARLQRSTNDYTFENRVSPTHPLEKRRNADRKDAHVTVSGRLHGLPLRAVGRIDAVDRGSPGRMGTRLFDEARWREVTGQLTLSAKSRGGSELSAGYTHRRQRYTDRRIDREESLSARQIRMQGRWRPGPSSPWLLAGLVGNERVTGDPLEGPSGRWMAGLTASRTLGSPTLEVTPSLSVDVAGGDPAVSPALAVGSRFAERWRAWARAGQAYRIPTFADLYLGSSYQVRPNPDLRPERVELDAEIGLEWSQGSLRARGSGFLRRTTDPIVWLPSSTAVWSARNAGRLRAAGAEAELKLSPAPGWDIRLTGTWMQSRVRFDADRAALPYQPEWSGGVAIERTSGARRALLRLRYTGPRPTSLAATHELPATALVDIAARQNMHVGNADLEIELGIRNLLDTRYELVELFPEPGRQLTVRVGIHARPRPGLPSDRQAGNMHEDGPSFDAGEPTPDPEVPAARPDGDPSDIPLS